MRACTSILPLCHSRLFVRSKAVSSRVGLSIYSSLVLHILSLGPLLQLEASGNDELLNGRHSHLCAVCFDAEAVGHLILSPFLRKLEEGNTELR
jgi:hypothetical protein